ncbi:MAG: hypothetical protein M9894_08365 [Planctomycetes bacterium]|nr:hypothetical protein [Planctomycetota bacterium]
MRSLPLASLVALAIASTAAPALADDTEAQRLLAQAYERWRDDTPDRCLELAEQALAAPPSTPLVRGQVLLFLGSLHQVKTGRLDDALACYDEVEALLQDDPGEPARRLRVQALTRKANIIYAEKDDHAAAIELYRQAQEVLHLASTADTASQLCYRVGRGAADPAERARWLDMALTLAQEAVDSVEQVRARRDGQQGGRQGGEGARGGARRGAFAAKFRVQLVLVLEALERKEEAAAVWAEVAPDDLDDNAQYQLALLRALRGDLDGAAEALRRSMATRPTASTRNQLRKYVRTEPDFQAALEREGWQDLVKDE